MTRSRAVLIGVVAVLAASSTVATTGDEQVMLVAHSLGGMAAMVLADQHPKLFGSKIVGVALLSTSMGNLAETELPSHAAPVNAALLELLQKVRWSAPNVTRP